MPPKSTRNSFNVTENIECDEQFGATKCVKDGEWIGGIHPRSVKEFEQLSFRCCRNSIMKKAKFQRTFNLSSNEEFKNGRDFYEKEKLIGFDYISNIIKFENEEGVNYKLFINRVFCIKNNFTNATDIELVNIDNNKIGQKQKIYQALIAEAENPNTVNTINAGEDLQNFNAVAPQDTVGSSPAVVRTCSNVQILTASGRGVDNIINQTSGIEAATSTIIIVNCTAATPNTPITMNWFGETLGRGISRGIGIVTRTLTCTNEGHLLLPPEDNTVSSSIVDTVECISSSPPPIQFVPQQAVFQAAPAAGSAAQYGAPSSGFGIPSLSYKCFSGDTLVTTIEGHKKRMDKLKINDWILSGDSEDGEIGFSKVTSWIHRKSNLMAEFMKFTLENGQSLKITKKHYIYKGNCNNVNDTNKSNMTLVYAENVLIHDCVFTLDKNGKLIQTRISKIELIQEKGIYAPLTKTGNIIVNDILASCYSNIDIKEMQQSLPSFNEIITRILSLIGLHHHLSLSSSPSSSFLKNEYDLIPGFIIFVKILKNVLPQKY